MRVLFEPIVRNNSSTISATNAGINYDPNNIKHPFIKKRFQAVSNSAVITILFTTDQSANCFFYGKHNLSALTVVFKNSVGTTIGTVVVGTINDIGVEYFTQIDGIRTIELTTSTASSYVRLGGFDAGVYLQMPDFVNSWDIDIIDNSIFDESLGGQMSTDDIEKRRAHAFEHREILKEDADNIVAAYYLNGKRPIFIDITERNRNFLAPVYARMAEPLRMEKQDRRYITTTKIREAG